MAVQILRKLQSTMPAWLMKILGNLWPPYLGAGIKVLEVSKDYRYLKVCLKRKWYNANYVGTQFGGSIYAMTDPFYMFLLINNLGDDYIVWDKAANIEFLRPGKTKLFAEFRIDQVLLDEVIRQTNEREKYVFDLPVEIKDEADRLIARVSKTLYVKKKKPI